ncbi:MAG TPA: ankyrin repeat domain-containing protein [Armatimonadota bacterium]|nr:ankyrin repeat domain-containing protein [Armatimonadota bacterium]
MRPHNRFRCILMCLSVLCLALATHAATIFDAVEQGQLATVKTLVTKYPQAVNVRDTERQTPLMVALTRCETSEIARFLLEKGAAVNVSSRDGSTPLLLAANAGKLDIVKILLGKGVDTHVRDDKGNTFLQQAAASKNIEIVKLALAAGGDVRAANDANDTPLLAALGITGDQMESYGDDASTKQFTNILKLLVEVLPSEDRKAAEAELAKRNTDADQLAIVTLLLDQGADANAVDIHGMTPLLAAAKTGEMSLVTVVLQHGANPLAKDKNECSFLHYAAKSGDDGMVNLALEKGCDAKARDIYRNTPLHYALGVIATSDQDFIGGMVNFFSSAMTDMLSSMLEELPENVMAGLTAEQKTRITELLEKRAQDPAEPMVKALVEHGADVNAVNINGDTALLGAAARGAGESVKLLVSRGADIKAANENGETVLYNAAVSGNIDAVKYLCDKGCSVNCRTEDGSTPLHAAAEHANGEMVEVLISKGANVTASDENGVTPLHSATRSMGGEEDRCISFLLQHGAKLNAQTKDGNTPLHLAAQNGYNDTVKQLLAAKANINAVNNEKKTPLALANAELAKSKSRGWECEGLQATIATLKAHGAK